MGRQEQGGKKEKAGRQKSHNSKVLQTHTQTKKAGTSSAQPHYPLWRSQTSASRRRPAAEACAAPREQLLLGRLRQQQLTLAPFELLFLLARKGGVGGAVSAAPVARAAAVPAAPPVLDWASPR